MRPGRRWLVLVLVSAVVVTSLGLFFWPRFISPSRYYYLVDSRVLPARLAEAERLARSANPEWREVACSIVEVSKDNRAVPLMLKLLLEDRDEGVRRSAAAALSEVDDPRIAGALTRPIRRMDPCARRVAAIALWRKSDPDAAAIFCWMLRSTEEMDRLTAIDGLGRLKGEQNRQTAVRVLMESLSHAPRRELLRICGTLVYLGAEEAVSELRQVRQRRDIEPTDREWIDYWIGLLQGRRVDPPEHP
ncbi:MAG: hypothetical protein AMXMBFR61_04150 [Fimbriimonadales bacterium]